MRIFSRNALAWKGDRLYLGRRFSGFSVVSDAKYPGVMWRVRSPDGTLSGMVNKTRAKDAAIGGMLRVLNSKERPSGDGLSA